MNPLRVLVLAANARYTHSSLAAYAIRSALLRGWESRAPWPPDATAATAATAAEPTAHRVEIRQCQVNQNRFELAQALALEAPAVLLVSISVWSAEFFRALLPDLRQLLPRCLMVLGGPEPSHRAADWHRACPGIDLIVAGTGETAASELARHGYDLTAFRLGQPQAFREEGGGLVCALPCRDFTRLPLAYRPEDFEGLAGHYWYYESSRGCPFACSYCLSGRDDEALELKPPEQVTLELSTLLGHGPRMIKFVDRSFNADPARARAIWAWLIEWDHRRWAAGFPGIGQSRAGERPARHVAEGDTRFHFEVHPALLEAEDLRLLAQAPSGLFQFEIGVQSVNPKALQAVGRPLDWAAMRQALAAVVALGTVHVHLDLIAGLPQEGMAEIGASFDAILGLEPDHFQLGFLKVLPGSPIAAEAGRLGIRHQAEAPYQVFSTPWLSLGELAELGQIEELVESGWNAGRGRAAVRAALGRGDSAFALYRGLAAHARASGFDLRTRQASKVEALWRDFEAQAASPRAKGEYDGESGA